MAILNPFDGLEGALNDIDLFYSEVEHSANDYSFMRLKKTVESAREKFKELSPEEKKAAQIILEKKYSLDVVSGEIFEELYEFLNSVENKEDWDPSVEDLQDYKSRRFYEQRRERLSKIYSGLSMIVIGILGNRLDNGGDEKWKKIFH